MSDRAPGRGYGRPAHLQNQTPRMNARGVVGDGPDPREDERNAQMARDREERERRGYGAPRDDRYRDDRYRDDYDRRYDDRYGSSRVSRAAERYANIGQQSRGGYGYDNPGNTYRYQSLGGTDSFSDSLIPPMAEKEVDEEYRLKEAYTRAANTVTEIEYQILTRTGSVGNAINDAMEMFKHPGGIKHEDPIFANFISDLKMQGRLYSEKVGDMICCGLVDIIGWRVFNGGGRIPAEELFRSLDFITLRTLLLEFGNWLEGYPDGWGLIHRLTPQAIQKLEQRDDIIDMFNNTIKNVSVRCGGSGIVDSTWRKKLLDNVRRRAPSRSPTYDSYLEAMDYDFGQINSPRIYNTYDEPQIHKGSNWDPIMAEEARAHASIPKSRSVDGELTKMTTEKSYQSSWPDSNWSYTPPEETITQENIVTLANIHEFDLREVDLSRWFKEIEGMADSYVVRPSDLRVIANLLEFTGKGKREYDVWISRILNTVPVVTVDWKKLTYDYVLIDVKNEEELEMILTNPEIVIPRLEGQSEQEMMADYEADCLSLSELEEQRKLKEKDPNAVSELDGKPKIVSSNKPYVFNQRKNMSSVIAALNRKANETSNEPVSATILPFVDCAEFNFDGISHNDVIRALPHLIEGAPFHHNFKEFIETTLSSIGARRMDGNADWEGVRNFLDRYFTTVINRWFVEERYFSPFYGEKRYIGCKSIFNDYEGILELLKENDHPSYVKLFHPGKDNFLLPRLQLFANSSTALNFATESTKSVDEELRDAVRNKILTDNVIVAAKGSIVSFIDIYPIKADGPKLVQRSSSPEMFYALDRAQLRSEKYFKNEEPVYITFAQDLNNVIWMLTPSPASKDKAMIVPIEFDQSLAMRKTAISEHIFTIDD